MRIVIMILKINLKSKQKHCKKGVKVETYKISVAKMAFYTLSDINVLYFIATVLEQFSI